ncbi:MAG: hypothetical protein KAT48_02500 [Bacteroidales bacterium]|nr:hypothetical protein [Bacteroidales bacterium]
MSYTKIEELLERYFAGDTSLKDEEEIRKFFLHQKIPDHLQIYQKLFESNKKAASVELPDDRFDEKLLNRINEHPDVFSKGRFNINWFVIGSIAAVALILLVIFVPMNRFSAMDYFSSKIEDTFDDPEKAYAVTMEALIMISGKLNAGTKPIEQMGKLNASLTEMTLLSKINTSRNDLSRLALFDVGLNEATKLAKFEESKEIIRNL